MASVIVIKIADVDVTDDVIFSDAEFLSQASGSPGTCKFRLKDMSYVYSLVVGQTLTLDVDGRRVWGGWVQNISRQFFFPYTGSPLVERRPKVHGGDPCIDVDPTAVVPRSLVIEGADYNLLLRKRFTYDKAHPARSEMRSWPGGTHDDVEIRWLCEHALDLSGDGIDYVSKVEYVGTPHDDRGNPVSAAWSWEDAMRAIARYTGAIFYIDPDKALVYTDVDTPNAAYKLTDHPVAADELGYREMEILFNGSNLINDALVWGAGQGAKRVKFKRTRDDPSIASHQLWQVGDFRGDLWRQSSVDKRSNTFVYGSPQNKRGAKDDAISAMVTLFKPEFRVAEKVDFTSGVYGFQDVIPIRRMKVTFPSPTEARFDLVLSHWIDEPWNTFEFWYPKLPLPRIVVDPPEPGMDGCPVPIYPATFDLPSGPTISLGAGMVPVFSDNFKRAGGVQPNGGDCGIWWPYIPTPANDGTWQVGGTWRIYLKTPISGDWQIVLGLDLTDWSTMSGSLTIGGYSENMIYLSSNGDVLVAGSSNYIRIPSSKMRGKVYVRSVHFKGYYSAMKIWPQGTPEPREWTATAPSWTLESPQYNPMFNADPAFVEGGTPQTNTISMTQVSSSGRGPKLMGITVFSGSQSIFASADFEADANAWHHSWPIDPPEDSYHYPEGGVIYGVGFGVYENTRNSAASPGYHASLVWGYLGGGFPGREQQVNQQIASVETGKYHSSYTQGAYANPPIQPAKPTHVKVSGKMTVGMGRSQGIDTRGDYLTGPHQIDVRIYVHDYGANEPFWLGRPEYRALGRQPLSSSSPGASTRLPDRFSIMSDSSQTKDFEFEVPYDEFCDPSGSGNTSFAWSAAPDNPMDKMREMDPRGGPFMLPNDADLTVGFSQLSYSGMWAAAPCGSLFCVANATGGTGSTNEQKTCEGVPINLIALHELYQYGEKWAVKLENAYQPGSVEVTVDGAVAKPALDFVETSPMDGTITFLNSFLNAKVITVCYYPEV